jgi:L-ascorbate metabolism protein UlaG (beta-lactamase superfamily)
VELPFSRETIIDVDAVIVTHTHDDHWDEAAIAAIPKTLPVSSSMTPTPAAARPGISGYSSAVGDSAFAGVRW